VSAYEKKILCEPNARKAFRMAKELAGTEGVVLVAGSLFLVGEIKKIIRVPIPV